MPNLNSLALHWYIVIVVWLGKYPPIATYIAGAGLSLTAISIVAMVYVVTSSRFPFTLLPRFLRPVVWILLFIWLCTLALEIRSITGSALGTAASVGAAIRQGTVALILAAVAATLLFLNTRAVRDAVAREMLEAVEHILDLAGYAIRISEKGKLITEKKAGRNE